MAQAASSPHTHSPNITYAHSPNLMHPHAHVAALHAYSPQPGQPPNIPHSSHSPHPNHSPHPVHPSHSPLLARAGHSPGMGPSHSPHFHAHSPSLQASSYFPPTRTPTFMQVHHIYPSPSPRPRPMSMHSGMGMGPMPGTPTMTYGIVGGMGGGGNMSLNTHMTTGIGMAAYDGSPMRTSAPEMGSPNASASNANSTGSTGGAGAHQDQSAAFNLCRRRVVAPGIEAVRVVNPQPLLLPNGFLWEFEIPRGMVPASLTNAILNV
ncbi:hypothetical protein RhiJN_04122 [Ceratobasidium sp. AG-Ba]|nr:hypothetical protein RhiJN_04122 [Ceratobasidium sp. AG-Ba]QRW05014.1 hypothetical protein RhiLY_04013 [Ceratobasidium sp. AG-Ba]